ncbi:LysR family transcriptional regulator [Klebsiella indica]|uniref:LysR family transcriptional regulator n=1 Tax=Klebsiella indica TaxID=2582917 RepID=A0A5R9LDG0_9ENTR|nr:LysR family transcriptional regulator [Klebsiella indica]TLV10707.1 LysR family transcriptional regulator [Klebsiella indica]
MKIERLREFLTLAEKLNFTKSAQILNITQPVLSRHMKELEFFFSVALFRRDTHQVELTSAGHLLADEARKIINQYENSLSVIHTFTGQSRRKLSIAFLGEAINQKLVELVDNFHQRHHDVAVDNQDCELDEAIDLLINGQCDLGFLIRPSFMPQNENFSYVNFGTDPLCVAVNRQHPLAGEQCVSLREVAKWPIIRINPHNFSQVEYYTTQFLSNHNLNYTLYREYPNLKTCCFNLELNTQAVLLMPKHRAYQLGSNSVLLELAEQDCQFELDLVWLRSNFNPCINLFVREFKKYMAIEEIAV